MPVTGAFNRFLTYFNAFPKEGWEVIAVLKEDKHTAWGENAGANDCTNYCCIILQDRVVSVLIFVIYVVNKID